MRLLNVSVALAAALFFSDQAFSCSVAQRADFAKAGYSKSEIESMCKGGGSGSPAGSVIAGVAKASPVAPFLGLWKQTSCEYWKNDTQLDLQCTPKGNFFVEFKQGTFRLPSGEHGVEYLDAGLDAVDVKGLDGKWSFRYQKLAPDIISTFLPDKANDRQARLILKRAGVEAALQNEQPRPDSSVGKIKIDNRNAGKLFTTAAPIDVFAEPREGSRKLATYQANAMMSTLGDVVGTEFMYVAPCNACDKGYIRKNDFLRKASQ